MNGSMRRKLWGDMDIGITWKNLVDTGHARSFDLHYILDGSGRIALVNRVTPFLDVILEHEDDVAAAVERLISKDTK